MVRPEDGQILLEDVADLTLMLVGMGRGVDPAKWIEVWPGGRGAPAAAPSPVAMLM